MDELIGEEGDNSSAFLVLRGWVRIVTFSVSENRTANQSYYEEDLCSGEMFGEGVLMRNQSKILEAQAVTDVDLAVIKLDDFYGVQGRDAQEQLTVDEKLQFLSLIPLFKGIDPYLLKSVATPTIQKSVTKGFNLTSYCEVNKGIAFILNGKVDISANITNGKQRNVLIASLSKYDHYGDVYLINNSPNIKKQQIRVSELEDNFSYVAITKLDILFFPEADFSIFNQEFILNLQESCILKLGLRNERSENQIKEESNGNNLNTKLVSQGPVINKYNDEMNSSIPSRRKGSLQNNNIDFDALIMEASSMDRKKLNSNAIPDILPAIVNKNSSDTAGGLKHSDNLSNQLRISNSRLFIANSSIGTHIASPSEVDTIASTSRRGSVTSRQSLGQKEIGAYILEFQSDDGRNHRNATNNHSTNFNGNHSKSLATLPIINALKSKI